MTDTDKLKRLAEGMAAREIFGIKLNDEECREYGQAILALIAEGERLKARVDIATEALEEIVDDPHCDVEGIKCACSAFLARIDAR